MVSKGITSNHKSAQHSTGPRTPEGKATSSRNALKHGLLSSAALLMGEDPEALASLGTDLRGALQPYGALEELLVERIVSCFWRLRRAVRMETGFLGNHYMGRLSHYGVSYDQMIQANDGKERIGKDLMGEFRETAAYGGVLSKASETEVTTKQMRYETAIERSLYRALHELQRLQYARIGQSLAPPGVLDIDLGISTNGHIPRGHFAKRSRFPAAPKAIPVPRQAASGESH